MSSAKRSLNPLRKEIETYNRLLPTMLDRQGKYALVKGSELIDVFESYDDALKAGYAKFQLAPFLVKLIAPAEQVSYFTRDLAACPS